MNSDIFNYLGIGWVDPAVIFIFMIVFLVILLALLISAYRRMKELEKRLEGFFEGKDARSLESEIKNLFGDIRSLKKAGKDAEENIKTLFIKSERSIQKLGLIKYDAFREMGGSLSFALCLLNETDSGFVMNSVHSSSGSYVYIKEILDGKSKIELGNEEQAALNMALTGAANLEYSGEWDSELGSEDTPATTATPVWKKTGSSRKREADKDSENGLFNKVEKQSDISESVDEDEDDGFVDLNDLDLE
ncbi:MAG: DUF4446 family protein [Lachnospiraceae bacterium]|nr:DUF4446 family protein [Lachnospiraceae bacterium]